MAHFGYNVKFLHASSTCTRCTHKQTNKLIDRIRDRPTNTQTYTDRQTNKQKDKQTKQTKYLTSQISMVTDSKKVLF